MGLSPVSITPKLIAICLLIVAGCRKSNATAVERVELDLLRSHIGLFRLSHEGYPTSLTELVQFSPNARSATVDVWDTPVRYTFSATSFTLQSAGPDRKFETADDIQVSECEK